MINDALTVRYENDSKNDNDVLNSDDNEKNIDLCLNNIND